MENRPGGAEKKRRSTKSYIIELSVKIGATALAVILLCSFVIGVFVNHGNSAYPMIKDGDLCITFRLGKLEKEDLAAYQSDSGVKFVRIIALEGDVVTIENGCVSVNGYSVQDSPYETKSDGSQIEYPYTVTEGQAFVLNDYRSDLNDSRKLGAVSLDKIKGKVIFIMRKRGF